MLRGRTRRKVGEVRLPLCLDEQTCICLVVVRYGNDGCKMFDYGSYCRYRAQAVSTIFCSPTYASWIKGWSVLSRGA